MKTHEAIHNRVSVRQYSNKKVKFGAILEAIDAANQAPFAGNINNLKFIIVESKENKSHLGEFSQQYWINDAQWIVIVCSEIKNLENLYYEKAQTYAKQQAGAAIQNLLLSLTDQGLGACWIGAFSEHEIKTKFRIPDNWEIEALIPIGYPKDKKIKKARKIELEGKIYWDVWGQNYKKIKYPHEDPATE